MEKVWVQEKDTLEELGWGSYFGDCGVLELQTLVKALDTPTEMF